MRLSSDQTQIIKEAVARLVGPASWIWLFGSRVGDALRGGDIDLLVETDDVMPNRIRLLCMIEGALVMALGGDRKLDILLKDARTFNAQIFNAPRRQVFLL